MRAAAPRVLPCPKFSIIHRRGRPATPPSHTRQSQSKARRERASTESRSAILHVRGLRKAPRGTPAQGKGGSVHRRDRIAPAGFGVIIHQRDRIAPAGFGVFIHQRDRIAPAGFGVISSHGPPRRSISTRGRRLGPSRPSSRGRLPRGAPRGARRLVGLVGGVRVADERRLLREIGVARLVDGRRRRD